VGSGKECGIWLAELQWLEKGCGGGAGGSGFIMGNKQRWNIAEVDRVWIRRLT